MNFLLAFVYILFFAGWTAVASPWDNFKLPEGLLKYKKKTKMFSSDVPSEDDKLPWWHKKSRARKNEQSVEKRTCGKDCTGHTISPVCAGVRRQKGVQHQFWSSCEFENYKNCNKHVGKLMYVIEDNFCRKTVPAQCVRSCDKSKVRPICATGDPDNGDYTYQNRCYFEVARCVARVNRGVDLRIRHRRCKNQNPHRFPSSFNRNWFIRTI